MSDSAAWIVIHADDDGEPGKILGWQPVPAGRSEDVEVTITAIYATRTLHALLYENAGQFDRFEVSTDLPVFQNDEPVAIQFDQIVE